MADDSRWSFHPLDPGEIPDIGSSWAKTPIDSFVLSKLVENDLAPQEQADRYSLIRRLTAGLTGLPPSPDEVEAFVSDPAPEAYEKLVDQLLDSPHYGERWGRHWLDVARFGESDGILSIKDDKVREDAWRYRDAVIRAFNADLPFDRFVRYQLGGEKNAPDDFKELKQFIHLGTRLQQNADPNDRMFHRLDDMVATTGSALLGLSFGCARCHDHPVDPMSTEEYYELTAVFFDQVRENPIAKKRALALEISEPRVLNKGSWRTPGEMVDPGFLKMLMNKPAGHWLDESPNRREALADWISDTENGAGMQLARVIVNRLWHHHFGRGLVSTPNDFGDLGARPSHPRLLDWLAGQLISNGWRLKPIHRMILTSATYKQAGAKDTESLAVDVENRWLWHRPVRRLEAEMIRDRLLAVSGVLQPEMFGPSIPVGNHKKTNEDGQGTWRRSIYLQAHRTVRHPTLSLFDPPVTEHSTGHRSTSASPEGALFALNSPLVWKLAERFAQRLKQEAGEQNADRIRLAYMLALSRPPTETEVTIGLELLGKGGDEALTDYCHIILGLNEFIYVE